MLILYCFMLMMCMNQIFTKNDILIQVKLPYKLLFFEYGIEQIIFCFFSYKKLKKLCKGYDFEAKIKPTKLNSYS